jgi:hypothetical protein
MQQEWCKTQKHTKCQLENSKEKITWETLVILEDNTEVDLREITTDYVNWNKLVQEWIQM